MQTRIPLRPAAPRGGNLALTILDAEPQEPALALGQRTKVGLRGLNLAIDRAKTIGIRAVREIESALAADTHARGFHLETNSTKEDVRDIRPGHACRCKSNKFEGFWLVPSLQRLLTYPRQGGRQMRHSAPAITLALALLVLSPVMLSAQQPAPDFLFGPPNGMVGFRSGWVFARAESDLQSFIQRTLTVDRKDFNAPAIGMDVEFWLTPRASIVGGFDWSQASKDSEYRDFVDNQRLPITQSTRLRELNLSGSVKFALTPHGREISRRAWIPAAVTPYVGAGAGLLRYELLQYGDFIDVNTVNMEVFTDTLRSDGWRPSAQVFGGVDIKLLKRMYLSGEARYLWSNATPDLDFDFDSIDLTGLKATVGIHYMF
jgi:Outer membrane protein W